MGEFGTDFEGVWGELGADSLDGDALGGEGIEVL
jgi:hypothetical protein